jgi:uncharacterized membrane protein (UPF0127 family)
MKFQRFLALIVAIPAILCGCKKPDAAADPVVSMFEPREAQPHLTTVRLWLGPEQMSAELASSIKEVMTGMMFRTNMAENESMLFNLPPPPQRAHFWMKNCFIPLSVAYIDPDGVILEIHDLQPQNTNLVDSTSENVAFALETRQGWFQRHNIHEGVAIRTERGSLAETFSRRP